MATPAVRNLIKENKLDINQVKGTGENGRILKEDVLNHMSSSKKESKETKSKSQPISDSKFNLIFDS